MFSQKFLKELPIPRLDTPEKQVLAHKIELLVEQILEIKGGKEVEPSLSRHGNEDKTIQGGTARVPLGDTLGFGGADRRACVWALWTI